MGLVFPIRQASASSSPVSRRAKQRVLLGRFVNWAARLYGYPSPMAQVRTATKQQLRRERGDIEWHELSEVEAALKGMPDVYWRAVLGTFAFAGLRLSELTWLRATDLQALDDDRWQLWVTTVDDGHGCRHELKTGNSQRAVAVHAERLQPLLEAHLDEGGAGEKFLFPIPPGIKRRKRKKGGHPERWIPEALARWLRGEASKDREGLLPEDMSPRSLRRTFGSLLLRSGKSVAEVAAAMGNTPQVVQEHYARIIGAEVSIDF